MRMCLIVGIVILLVVIIVPSGKYFGTHNANHSLTMPSRCNKGEVNVFTPDTTKHTT